MKKFILLVLLAMLAPAHAKEFRLAYQADAASMDPHFFNEAFTQGFLNNFYDGLVQWDDHLQIAPALATDWQMTSPTTWVFHLRHGVTFHGGENFTADDVVFSYQRAMGPDSDYWPTLTDVAAVKAVDDFTVEITTKSQYVILPRTAASVYIISHAWAIQHDALTAANMRTGAKNYASLHEDGTGPFRLIARQPDVSTRMEAFPAWWDRPTHDITTATFTPIKDAATRVAALLSGQVDMIWPVPLQDMARLNRTPGIKIAMRPSEWVIFLRWDLKDDQLHGSSLKGKNPFRDVTVREAIYRAIDIDSIESRVMRGTATLDAEPVAPTTNGFDPALNKRPAYDPDRARQLLAAAGYPEGFDFTLDCPNDRFINDETICQAILPMLARVGLKVSLSVQNRIAHFTKLKNGLSDMYLVGWAAAGVKDAHNTLIMQYGTPSDTRGGTNYGGYSNPKLDHLIDALAAESDPAVRQLDFDAAFSLLQNDWAFVPLHVQPTVWGMRSNVETLQLPDDNIRLWRTVVH